MLKPHIRLHVIRQGPGLLWWCNVKNTDGSYVMPHCCRPDSAAPLRAVFKFWLDGFIH